MYWRDREGNGEGERWVREESAERVSWVVRVESKSRNIVKGVGI
jgi:hypothetical protein